MKLINMNEAQKQFNQILDCTIDNNEEVIILSDRGNLVIISQDDWEQTQETLKLLNDKVALKALLYGHRIRDEGGKPKGKTIPEVFGDLGN